MFEFWIDGVKYADPLNWKDFTESIEYDDELKVFLFKYENKLTFSGGAYNYLYTTRNSGGVCGISEIIIKKSCANSQMLQIFKGKIFISDCLFYTNKCIVDCSIQDDNYASFLFNNKNIKVPIAGTFESKNGVVNSYPIVGLNLTYLNTGLSVGDFWQYPTAFNTDTGASIPLIDTKCFFLHDLFNYIVCFITDGNCTFYSDYLNWTLPITTESEKVRNLTVTLGKNIRNYGKNIQEIMFITFDQLFKEVNRLYPIILTIEYASNGKPIIRIEDEGSIRQTTSSIKLSNLTDVREKADNALLYGTIRIGSPTATFDSAIHTYPTTQKDVTFKEETYYLNGYCNVSTQKDLFGEYVVDSNVIEELIGNSSNFDSNIIFLEVDTTTVVAYAVDALKTPDFDNITDYHYNDNLLNINVVKRNQFHGNTTSLSGEYVDLINISTSATSTVALGSVFNCASGVAPAPQTTSFQPLNFVIDNITVFDGLSYTALVSGSYNFNYELSYKSELYNGGSCPATIMNRKFIVKTVIERYNSLNVLQETQSFSDNEYNSEGVFNYNFQPTFTMLAGDYIKAKTNYTSEPVDFTQDSGVKITMFLGLPLFDSFETLSTPTSTGVNSENNGLNYLSNIVTFNKAISEQEYNTLKNSTGNSIQYNVDGVTNKKAWIKRVTKTLATGEMDWELISNITNSQ